MFELTAYTFQVPLKGRLQQVKIHEGILPEKGNGGIRRYFSQTLITDVIRMILIHFIRQTDDFIARKYADMVSSGIPNWVAVFK